MNIGQLRRAALELAGAFLALTLLALAAGHHYAELWLPLYRGVAAWLLPEYRIVDLVLRQGANETVLALTVETAGNMVVGLKFLPAGTSMTSTTLAGYALQHPVLLFSLLLAWPTVAWRNRWQLILMGVPLLFALECLDTPFVLAGAVQDLVLGTLAPAEAASSWLIGWTHLVNGGGRLALSLAAAFIVVNFHAILASRPLQFRRT